MRAVSRSLILLTLATLTATSHLAAQVGPSTGSRVRAFAPTVAPDPLLGRVAASTVDSLLLSVSGGAATLRLDKRTIERLDVSRGRNRLAWSLVGAGVGFLGGGIIGGAIGGHNDNTGLGALAGVVGGVVIGVPVGAIGGALLAPERWVRYSLPRQE